MINGMIFLRASTLSHPTTLNRIRKDKNGINQMKAMKEHSGKQDHPVEQLKCSRTKCISK